MQVEPRLRKPFLFFPSEIGDSLRDRIGAEITMIRGSIYSIDDKQMGLP